MVARIENTCETFRSDSFEQLLYRHSQCLCNLPKVQDRDVSFAALDRADERTMQFAFLAELRLGQVELGSAIPDPVSGGTQEVLIFQVHGGQQWCRLP